MGRRAIGKLHGKGVCISEKASHRIHDTLASIPAFYWFCVAAISLGPFIALLSHGGVRGLYADDYAYKRHAVDLATGAWRPRLGDPFFRPLSTTITLNLAAAIPDVETPVRIVWALMHLTNAALVGGLTYRILRSRLAAALSILLSLVPVSASESLLWHSGASGSGLGLTMFLLSIHLLLTAIQREKRWIAPACAGMFCVALMLLTYEQYAVGMVSLPLFSIFTPHGQGKSRIENLDMFRRAGLLTVIGILIAWLYWFLLLSRSPAIGSRGGLEFNVHDLFAVRVGEVVRGAAFLTVGEWGLGGMWRLAFRLGIDQASREPITLVALGILIVTLIGMVASSGGLTSDDTMPHSDTQARVGLFLIGISWSVLAFVPALIIRHQAVVIRMLYFPWAGLALSSAVLGESLHRVLARRHVGLGRIVIVAVASVYVVGILILAGFAHVYRFRAEHDQRQMSALIKAAPSLPRASEVVLLPIHLDERSVSHATGRDNRLDLYLEGAFERVWGAENIARIAYKHPDITAITATRWEHFHFTDMHKSPHGDVDEVVVNGRRVAAHQLLAFTYADDRVVLVNRLVLVDSNGTAVNVSLPLVDRVRTSGSAVQEMRFTLEPVVAALQ